MEQFAEAAGAAIGGFFSSSVLFPMEIIKTKSAAEKDKSLSVLQIAKRELKQVGITGLYQGAHVGGLQSAMEKFLYFYNFKTITNGYVLLRNQFSGGTSTKVGVVAEIALGYAAEWSHLPISLPCDAIQTRMKVNRISFVQAFKEMYAEVGQPHPKGNGRKKSVFDVFYKVLFPFIVLCLKPAIQNSIFERIRKIVLGYKVRSAGGKLAAVAALTAAEAFFVGAIARIVATLVVFPYNRIKILLQSTGVRRLLRNDDARFVYGACLWCRVSVDFIMSSFSFCMT